MTISQDRISRERNALNFNRDRRVGSQTVRRDTETLNNGQSKVAHIFHKIERLNIKKKETLSANPYTMKIIDDENNRKFKVRKKKIKRRFVTHRRKKGTHSVTKSGKTKERRKTFSPIRRISPVRQRFHRSRRRA